ncbi:MAG: hypothetical protein MZV70_59285 [Desulfobacterales bacterium]|nr:hypothetical protein [Desulfobacterales bacterium]
MKTHPVVWSIVLSLFILFLSQPAFAEDPAKDAKTVFVKLVEAAKAKNTVEFKSYIAKEDLKEMEKEGFVDMMMDVMAEENPDLFKASVKENQVIFTKEIQRDVSGRDLVGKDDRAHAQGKRAVEVRKTPSMRRRQSLIVCVATGSPERRGEDAPRQ